MSEGQELAIPGTGELVDLNDAQACVRALDSLRDFESVIREVKGALTRAIIYEATLQGVRSIELSDGSRAEISPSTEIVYDAQAIEDGLRAAGMPEERIRDIVEETVSYKVHAREAKKAARANPEYAKVIDEASMEAARQQYVTIRRKH